MKTIDDYRDVLERLAAMSTKGTPRPWSAERGADGEDDRWGIFAAYGDRKWHLATIENGAPGDSLVTEGETAQLIAEAVNNLPDLLAIIAMSIEVMEEIRRLTREAIDVNAVPGVCGYCLLPIEAGVDAGRAHAAKCQSNPLVQALEAIVALARKYAHPGVNPGAHGLASEILRIAGERPTERSE